MDTLILRRTAVMIAGVSVLGACAEASEPVVEPAQFYAVFHPTDTSAPIANAKRCPGRNHPLVVTLRGTADTSLGPASFVQTHCTDAAMTALRNGRETLRLGSGDVLFGVYSADIVAQPAADEGDSRTIVQGVYHHTGGSGIFANARGSGVAAGGLGAMPAEAEVVFSGSL